MKLQLIYIDEVLGLAPGLTAQIIYGGLEFRGVLLDGIDGRPERLILSTAVVEKLIDYIMSNQVQT